MCAQQPNYKIFQGKESALLEKGKNMAIFKGKWESSYQAHIDIDYSLRKGLCVSGTYTPTAWALSWVLLVLERPLPRCDFIHM